MRFDPAAIDEVMRSAQIPVWGNLRPNVWLSTGVDNLGQVSGLDEQQQEWLLAAMARRGLPVKQVNISPAQLQQLNRQSQAPLVTTGKEVALVLWLENNGDQWSASWSAGLGTESGK